MNSPPRKATDVAGDIQPLVILPDYSRDDLRHVDLSGDVKTVFNVRLQHLLLQAVDHTRLVEDVGGIVDLSDVVQHRTVGISS